MLLLILLLLHLGASMAPSKRPAAKDPGKTTSSKRKTAAKASGGKSSQAAVGKVSGKDRAGSGGRRRQTSGSLGTPMKKTNDSGKSKSSARGGSRGRKESLSSSRNQEEANQTVQEEDSEAEDFEQDPVVEPDQLLFVDASLPRPSLKFDKAISNLPPGSALLVRHLLPSGKVDVDAFYYLDSRIAQKDGLLCSCTFLGASGKAHSDLQNI